MHIATTIYNKTFKREHFYSYCSYFLYREWYPMNIGSGKGGLGGWSPRSFQEFSIGFNFHQRIFCWLFSPPPWIDYLPPPLPMNLYGHINWQYKYTSMLLQMFSMNNHFFSNHESSPLNVLVILELLCCI